MVDLNVHDMDERTEKLSSFIFLRFIQYILLLTFVLLLLDSCAANLIFEQTAQHRAVVPVDVVVQELGILWTKRISRNRKGKFISSFFRSTSFPSNC